MLVSRIIQPATRLACQQVRPFSAKVGTKVQRPPVSPRIKEMQELFQRDDGIPVHLKRGNADMMLYMLTLGSAIVGAGASIYIILDMARPKKPE